MPDPQTLLLFFASALLLAAVPGPDNLFVLAQSAQHGSRAGLAVTSGLCTGLLGHTLAVTCGIAALLAASATAFLLLKALGAAYLFFLAWQAWQARTATLDRPPALSLPRLYRRGIIMNLCNPKVSIFFLAFLPQFTDPVQGPVAPQLITLGALFILATILVFGAIALAAGHLGRRARQTPTLQRLLNRSAAILFTALAVKLLLSQG